MNGKLIFITGPMFASKTTTLIKLYNKCKTTKIILKPSIDNRYGENVVKTHDGIKIQALNITNTDLIYKLTKQYEHIFIDEIQFFRKNVIKQIIKLITTNHNVTVAGLITTAQQKPFKFYKANTTVVNILPYADKIMFKKAKCQICNKTATKTIKIKKTKQFIGNQNIYSPRCYKHTKTNIDRQKIKTNSNNKC